MALNLTQPIILNPVLNATLIQPSQPWYKDWLPAIIGILGIILGGIITYYANFRIQSMGSRFQIKKTSVLGSYRYFHKYSVR
jgi:uncharacterized integral membrane protein